MVNILIADDNIEFAKLLVNDIVSTNENLRIVKIATNGKETLELMNKDKIDIVLLDLKMPIYNGYEILEKLSDEKKKEYENSIIVITGEAECIPKIMNNKLVAFIVLKGANQYEDIMNKIDRIVEIKLQYIIRKKIITELHNIGYNLNHVGTQYLAEAIFEIYKKKDDFNGNLEKEIYPLLSIHFQKSIHNIKCNITRATENMSYYCCQENLDKYFEGIRPTTKTVISIILSRIL